MPYLRVYSRGLPIEKKRIIAQRLLIEITLHTFQLPPGQRNQVPLEFVTESPLDRLDGHALIPGDADFKLEVIIHHLSESGKRAFGEEAVSTFAELGRPTIWERIAGTVGVKSSQRGWLFS